MNHDYSWLRGFVRILHQPHQTGLSGNAEPLKSLVFAGLLETAASLMVAWLHRKSPELIAENILMMKPWMKNGQQQQPSTLTSLPFDQALLSTLTTSFIGILAFGFVLWIIHWALTKESRKLYEIAGIASYGSGVYALGTVVTGIMAFSFGSLQWGPHLGILIDPSAHPFMFAIMARINVFSILSYVLASYAMIGYSRIESRYGLISSIIAIGIVMSWYAVFSLIGSYLTS
ncbi:MAG: hypothetical protein ACK5GO_00160 [Ignavibacteria bacterium]|jgi:hypothetical protein